MLDDRDGYAWTPAWAPDGSTFATARTQCLSEWVPLECGGEVTSSLVLVDAESGTQRVALSSEQLGDGLGVGVPVWSRDSTRIAFTAFSPIGDPLRVFVVDADGTNLVDLGDGSVLQWSPDGEWLLVSRPADVESSIDLWIMRADGSDARSLGTFLGSFTAPAGW
jgi:Tol biopolymer transport system component